MISFIISVIPIQFLKVFLFNIIGFKVKNSKIGFFVFIKSSSVEIENSEIKSFNIIFSEKISIKNSKILKFNHFKNIFLLELINSSVGNLNKFTADKKHKIKNNSIQMYKTEISNSNLFDLTSSIEIYEAAIKNKCQFWTHEFDILRKIKLGTIKIERNVSKWSCT